MHASIKRDLRNFSRWRNFIARIDKAERGIEESTLHTLKEKEQMLSRLLQRRKQVVSRMLLLNAGLEIKQSFLDARLEATEEFIELQTEQSRSSNLKSSFNDLLSATIVLYFGIKYLV